MSSDSKHLIHPPGLGVAPAQAEHSMELARQMQRQAEAKLPRSHASSHAAVLISLMPRLNAVKRCARLRLRRVCKRVSTFKKTFVDCGLGINDLQNLNTLCNAFKLRTRILALFNTHSLCHRHPTYRPMHPHHRRDQSGRGACQVIHKVMRPSRLHKRVRHNAKLSLPNPLFTQPAHSPTRGCKADRVPAGSCLEPRCPSHLGELEDIHLKVASAQLAQPHQSFGSTSAIVRYAVRISGSAIAAVLSSSVAVYLTTMRGN
jgi:hypothetical protein